jgi:hypothetical protein
MCIDTKIEVRNMGYGRENYPGRGPFNHLPPQQRPGHFYGRGACWYLYEAPYIAQSPTPQDETTLLNHQKTALEEQIKAIQQNLQRIQTRLNEISK